MSKQEYISGTPKLEYIDDILANNAGEVFLEITGTDRSKITPEDFIRVHDLILNFLEDLKMQVYIEVLKEDTIERDLRMEVNDEEYIALSESIQKWYANEDEEDEISFTENIYFGEQNEQERTLNEIYANINTLILSTLENTPFTEGETKKIIEWIYLLIFEPTRRLAIEDPYPTIDRGRFKINKELALELAQYIRKYGPRWLREHPNLRLVQ